MKIKIKERVYVDKEIEVDSRVFNEDSQAWQIANIIHGSIAKDSDFLYSKDAELIIQAAHRINNAFMLADRIIAILPGAVE